ncbi:MAG: TRAP transporter large permease [candidate division NC10 bacterium]|nr:TRAP transporter large permease [candidate division NC10 bacterium]
MTVILACLIIALLMLLSVPIAFSIGLGSVYYFLASGKPLMMIPQKMFTTVDNFTLLAVPLFILAGNIMNTGGITKRLFNFARTCVGHITGGLGHVCVLASIIFAGMSGSATADAVGLGSIEIPAMEREGYDKAFSSAIVLGASTIGPIIPPSIIMVIYAVVAGVSVGALFVAGIIPGLIMGVGLMVGVYIISKKRKYPSYPRATFRQLLIATRDAFPVLLTPVIIIGGIYTGYFTPTEAAMIAVVYAVILGFFYGEISFRAIWQILRETSVTVGVIMFIIGITGAFAWWLSLEKIPLLFTEYIYSLTHDRMLILLMINLIILVEGCFLDATPIVLIMVPILMPLLKTLNVDMVYFGILISVNTMIGLTTPPVGVCLYGVSAIAKLPMERIVRAYIPFLTILIVVLFLLQVFPQLSLFLPNLLFK